MDFDSATQHISKLRLHGGLAGKICYVLIYVSLAIACIAWAVRTPFISILALSLIFIIVIIALWRLFNLADKNPQAALMEGEQYLAHERILIGTKNNPEITVEPSKMIPSAPLELTDREKQKAEMPDPEEPSLSLFKDEENKNG